MKRVIVLSIVFIFGFIGISNAQVDDTKARGILNKVSEKAKKYNNMKFDFTYRMVDKAHNIDESLKGTIVVQDEKYNLDFMGRKIICDGTTSWTYDSDAEEIQITTVNKDEDAFNPSKLLTSYDENYRSKFIKTQKDGAKSSYIIDLYPVKGKSFFKIRLQVDTKTYQVVSAAVYSKDNITYTYSINKFEHDVTVGTTYFTMDTKKYSDADVVDLR